MLPHILPLNRKEITSNGEKTDKLEPVFLVLISGPDETCADSRPTKYNPDN